MGTRYFTLIILLLRRHTVSSAFDELRITRRMIRLIGILDADAITPRYAHFHF